MAHTAQKGFQQRHAPAFWRYAEPQRFHVSGSRVRLELLLQPLHPQLRYAIFVLNLAIAEQARPVDVLDDLPDHLDFVLNPKIHLRTILSRSGAISAAWSGGKLDFDAAGTDSDFAAIEG